MGLGKISDPGISTLNKTKLSQEGEEKRKLWGNYGTVPDSGGSSKCVEPNIVNIRPFSPGKTRISMTFMQLFNHSRSRSDPFSHSADPVENKPPWAEDLGCVIWDILSQRGSMGGVGRLPD